MAREPRDFVLAYLRRIDGKIDGMAEDISSIKLRMSTMERHLLGQMTTEYDQNDEIGRLKHRVDRIEWRLEPSETLD
jgi:hypothetical protein